MFNQYQPQMPQYNGYPQMRQYGTQRQEVVRVNGEGGANAYQLMPNSSALLLDETAPVVWLVTTDGAGYKSMTPYKITPFENQQKTLEERIKRLEDMIYAKSNDATLTAAGQYAAAVPAVPTADAGQGPTGDSYGPAQQRQDEPTAI